MTVRRRPDGWVGQQQRLNLAPQPAQAERSHRRA
jgi:hypothetical protein